MRLTVSVPGVLSYAMAHNVVPVVSAVEITTQGVEPCEATLDMTIIDGDGALSHAWSRGVSLPASGTLRLTPIDLILDERAVLQLKERRPASVVATLTGADGLILTESVEPVVVLAAHQWSSQPLGLGLEMLAAHVMPNAPEIAEVVAAASRLLVRTTGDGSIQGYQAGPERVDQIVRAVYEVMAGMGIHYSEPPPSWADLGQKIRTPAEVLRGPDGTSGGAATCLDSSVVFSAALEHAGIRPLLWLPEGHAFVAYWREEASLAGIITREPNDVITRVELGQVGVVETTGISRGWSFDRAQSEARESEVRRPLHQLLGIVDVHVARRNSIVPLPAQWRDASGRVTVVSYVPAEHSAAPGRVERDGTAPKPARDPAPPRFGRWKNALLDLSLRNRLINFTPRTGIRVELAAGDDARIEDALDDERRVSLVPFDALDAIHYARTQITSARDLPDDVLGDVFRRTRSVVVDLTSDAFATALRNLAYRARTIVEETGANSLYLTLGELVWEQDGRPLRSPLLLLPVQLRTTARGRAGYSITLDDTGQATPNYCLVEKLRHEHGLSLPGLEDPPQDRHGIDVAATMQSVRVDLVNAGLPFRVDQASYLSVLQFAKYRLWKDIDDSWEAMLASPMIRHLALTPTDNFADPTPPPLPVDLDELGAACPVAADASQLGAIAEALGGRSFVLEGPPGTGKSQTITNLLAAAVADGKRVLFVAEKRAALEVVKRRLDDVGLASICLDLHDKGSKPADVRRQILSALDLVTSSSGEQLALAHAEQAGRRRPLARYSEAVHTPNGAGMSLYGAWSRQLAPSDQPALPLPVWAVAPEQSGLVESLRSVARLLPEVADAAGPPATQPWGFVCVDDPRVDVVAIRGVARQVDEAFARLRSSAALGAVIDSMRTPAEADAIAALLAWEESDAGAPYGRLASLEAIGAPAWEAELQRVRRDLQEYGRRRPPSLDVVTPTALDLDLDGLLLRARQAAASGWWGRRGRLLEVWHELSPAWRPGVRVKAKHVEGCIEALRITKAEGASWSADIRGRLPGIQLPSGWHPLTGADELTRAADRARLSARLIDAGVTQPGLVAATREYLARPQPATTVERAAVTTLADGLRRLAGPLAADVDAFTSWSGDIGLAERWRATADRRALDDPSLMSLRAWLDLRALVAPVHLGGLEPAHTALLFGGVDPDMATVSVERGLAEASVAERLARGQLATFDPVALDRSVERFRSGADRLRGLTREGLLDTALRRRTFAASASAGSVGALRRELSKQRRGLSVRELLTQYGDLIAEVMPCALVSPDSLARFYPVDPGLFDLVVFDEASQIRVSDAIGPIARAKAVVVVGDSKQMPPTSFAEVNAFADEAEPELDVVEDEESILSESVQAGLPRRWLTWHYRSQDEALIAFSNAHYYDGRLASFPAPVTGPADPGIDGHGISLVRVDGDFLRSATGAALRTNPVEASAIVAEIKRRYDAVPDGAMPSIGVATFNAQQRTLIEAMLTDSGDERIVAGLDAAPEGLFVKNLENVQGDERDAIFFSTAFSVNSRGELPLNFGPLNRTGGERRLNVAITRARRQVLVFSSFDPEQLRAEQTSSVGVKHLRAYLDLAAAGSALTVLAGSRRAVADAHREEVAVALRSAGLVVKTDVGLSDFRIDLELSRAQEPDRPLVAVLLDSVEWARRPTVSDRFDLPESVLGDLLRWPAVEWVWLPAWVAAPDAVVSRLVAAAEAAAAGPQPSAQPTWELLPSSPDSGVDDGDRQSVPSEWVEPARTSPRPDVLPLVGEAVFVPWTPGELGPRSVLDAVGRHSRDAVDAVARAAVDCVRAESPVHVDRVAKLVAGAFDLSRVTAARAAVIKRAAGLPDSGFVWLPGIDPAAWRGFRRAADASQRPLEHVAPEELVNAMEALARATRGMAATELASETLAIFGVSRRASRVMGIFTAAMEHGVATGRLRRESGLIRDGDHP